MNTDAVHQTLVTTKNDKGLIKDATISTSDSAVKTAAEVLKATDITTIAAKVGSSDANARMLINNIAQLQDIDRADTGNLAGKYALGKDIDANSDTASYIENDAAGKAKYLYVVAKEGNAYDITAGNYMKIDLENTTAKPTDAGKLDHMSMNSSTWNSDKGFNPIGNGDGTTNAFTGSFDGFGGDATHSISNLTEKLGAENNVGLFGYVKGGSLIRVHLINTNITGQNNVGGIAGTLEGGSVNWSSNSGAGLNGTKEATTGFVKTGSAAAATNIGGLVGYAHTGATISNSNNSATVIGLSDDAAVNITNVGGIVGNLNGATAVAVGNSGNVFGEKNTGGLAGSVTDGAIGTTTNVGSQYASVNRGQITGNTNTGGVAGYASKSQIKGVYNSNESSDLAASSQYFIDASGKIVKRGDGNATVVDKNITDNAVKSAYGKITGTGENTGGIVGLMENTSTVDTAYNAGNITGTTNVGGIAGTASNSAITNAYNGDNNTVVRETIAVPTNIQGLSYTDPKTGNRYQYNSAVLPEAGVTATEYYSFYTMENGVKTYYYYLPSDGTVSKGAGGVFAKADGTVLSAEALAAIKMSDRYYMNRVGYKDATVTGSANVGGIVGAMTGGSSANTVYNAGKISSNATASLGALVGMATGSNNTVSNSFFVTGQDASTGMSFSGAANATNGTVTKTNILDSTLQTFRNKLTGTGFTANDFLNADTWTIYQDQTLPLLKYFMENMAIDRTFVYDGTTHNLKTDDVNDVYGRADFDGELDGTVVNNGIAGSEVENGSTKYHYTTSSIWSPQHGYLMNAESGLTITPVDLEVEITGERTYGAATNVQGYYICVPYTVNGKEQYVFYNVDTTDQSKVVYTKMSVAKLGELFGDKAQTLDNLKLIAKDKYNYVVTLRGMVATEVDKIGTAAGEHANKVLSSLILTKNNTDLNVNHENQLWVDGIPEQQLTVSDKYTFNNENMQGLVAEYGDYNIKYSGQLTVNKANLDYTYDGTREYGSDWKTNNATATLVGVDADSSAQSINGFLKSWDVSKVEYNSNLLLNSITQAITDATMKGTLNNETKDITVAVAGTYFHVNRDNTGKVISYKVTDFADTGIVIKGKSDADTAYLAQNYNFNWVAEGTTYAGSTVVAKESTQTITPATLTVTVNGNRDYSDLMNTTQMDINKTNATNGIYNIGVTGVKTNTGDTATNVLDADKLKELLGKIEATTGNSPENQINEKTDVGAYNIKDGAKTDSNINVANTGSTDNKILSSTTAYSDYVVANGEHKLTITPKKVTVTTSSEKTYGQANPGTGSYNVEQSGLAAWDEGIYNNNVNAWKGTITNSTVNSTDAGKYGTVNGGTKVLGIDVSAGGLTANKNYTINYADSFVINKKNLNSVTVTVTGNRDYGTIMGTDNWTASNGVLGSTATTENAWNIGITGGASGGQMEAWDLEKLANGNYKDLFAVDADGKYVASTHLAAVDKGDGSGTQIGSHTNASGTDYNLKDGSYTSSNLQLEGEGWFKNYTIDADGNHALHINQADLTITTTANSTYGDTTLKDTKVDATSGLKDWDKTLFNDNVIAGNIGVIGNVTNTTGVGSYGTNGTTGIDRTAVIGYTTTQQTDIANDLSNYKITYKDNLAVGKKDLVISINGSKQYGTQTSTSGGDYNYGFSGLVNGEQVNTGSLTVNNTVSTQDGVGRYTSNMTGATGSGVGSTNKIVGFTGTVNGSDGFDENNYNISYATTFEVTKAHLTITTSGSKTYGEGNGDVIYTVGNTGLNAWDNNLYNGVVNITNVVNNTTELTDAGKYGSVNGGNTVLSRGDEADIRKALDANYDITFADDFTIDKRNITVSQNGSKEYGTGSNHASYGSVNVSGLNNAVSGQASAITGSFTTGNSADRTTNVGTYSTDGNNATMSLTANGADVLKNYNVTTKTEFVVTPADFTYTANNTEYWYGVNIPAQSGHVTNSYGEDVTDLVGAQTWYTPAHRLSESGLYSIIGSGSNDGTGNYTVAQALGNDTALKIKMKLDTNGGESNPLIWRTWGPARRQLLAIRYLFVEGTTGIDRWEDTPGEVAVHTTLSHNGKKRYQF